MAIEIERKFLVNGEYKSSAVRTERIIQGYIGTVSGRTVRIRIMDDKGFITIKGRTGESGMSRFEWEKEIPQNEALDLLKLCDGGVIDKSRFLVPVGSHTFEVDEFYGANQGLTVAEVELGSEDEAFEKPSWLGSEVTGDKKYYNSHLLAHPFKDW